jgi:hypothetical protein
MPIREIQLEVSSAELPVVVLEWLKTARARIELYWDRFREKPLPQYVECDFDYVSTALRSCIQQGLIDGKLFCEWGCGFAVVAGVAGLLGLDAIGIEAEEFLCTEARQLLSKANVPAEVWQGNFLPRGAANLADDTDPLVSLTHDLAPAYEQHDMNLSDFAIIFAYPWPGEEHFLKAVFNRFARPNAVMLMYRGPFQVELYRKV